MFEEGLIQSVEGDLMDLDEGTSRSEIEWLRNEFFLESGQAVPASPQTSTLRGTSAPSKGENP
jgi:hypothetical protein